MLIAALVLNLVILVPLVAALSTGMAGMDAAFGPVTDARRILACVYAAIGVVSAGLLVLHATGHVWAVPMTVALFAVQITYKLGTGFAVGIASPVVVANLGVVAVQVIALAALAKHSGLLTG